MSYRIHVGARPQAQRSKDRCPRCGGNMIRHGDQYGLYASCLQCGKTVDVQRRPAPEALDRLAVEWREDGEPGKAESPRLDAS